MRVQWKEESDVIVVGYGGAGAIAAINAYDSGARVLILEKQPSDTPTRTRHTPNTRMSGGGWFGSTNPESTALYLEGMVKTAHETLDIERKQLIAIFARYLVNNKDWLIRNGVEAGEVGSINEYTKLPGAEGGFASIAKTCGQYRHGAAFFKYLSDAVQRRRIPVMWETPAVHLVMQRNEVRGVIAKSNGKQIGIKANRAVILTCGGFEFNDWMKENYLRVHPSHFYGNPANTGDGINMTMEIGALQSHMNNASWRAVMKFPDFPVAFSTRNHKTTVLVDKLGRRFSTERYQMHSFGYELTNYDSQRLTYPKVPCYIVFDEKRRKECGLASPHGACNPPGGVMGDTFYDWSEDNQKEVDRGWIVKSSTIEALASKLYSDPDNGECMSSAVLRETIRRYNELCHKGEDTDFHKPQKWLQPLEDPPYYAIKLWPGGANTQGGPQRNVRGQVVNVNKTPIPRLYSAGEMGSVWGMLYCGGGNIAECIAFGRIAGTNAAAEKPWK